MEQNNIFLTTTATNQIKLQLIKRNTPKSFLRLGVKGSGCSGYSYSISFDDDGPREKDLLFEIENVKVIVDKKSILYLNGMTLDFVKTVLNSGFKFINPNVVSTCSCGSSFDI